VARAFAWTRANVAKYGGDPDNIILCGHSAGGHLVSLLATDESLLADPELKLTDADRKALRGVVSVSGVYLVPRPGEFSRLVEGMLATLGVKDHVPELLKQSGMALNPFPLVFGNDPKQHRQASPLHHVRPGLAPFLVVYSGLELPFLPQMAEDFGEAMRKAKNDVEVVRFDQRDHNSVFFRMSRSDDPAARKVLDFVQRHR